MMPTINMTGRPEGYDSLCKQIASCHPFSVVKIFGGIDVTYPWFQIPNEESHAIPIAKENHPRKTSLMMAHIEMMRCVLMTFVYGHADHMFGSTHGPFLYDLPTNP